MTKELKKILTDKIIIKETEMPVILSILESFLRDDEFYFNKIEDALETCFENHQNLYLVSSEFLKNNDVYTKIAIKNCASNVLSIKIKDIDFYKLSNFIEINPFVSIYCIYFKEEKIISELELNLLYKKAFEISGCLTFFQSIKDDAIKEEIVLDIYFKKLVIKNFALDENKEFKKYLKRFTREELKNIEYIRNQL